MVIYNVSLLNNMFVHARMRACVCVTFWPLDTGMLVVTQEKALSAAALIAAHHVDAYLLTSAIAFRALIHICPETQSKINKSALRQTKNYND